MTFFSNDIKQLKRLKASDTNAFKSLYLKYFEPLYRYIYYQTYQKELSEDILQEVFCRIWEKREQIDPDQSFQAFVYRIAHHLVIDHYRKSSLKKEHLQQISFREFVEEQPPVELELTIMNALNALPFKIRTTFILHRFQNLSYDEIASTLNISKKTVEYRIGQALEALRQALDED